MRSHKGRVCRLEEEVQRASRPAGPQEDAFVKAAACYIALAARAGMGLGGLEIAEHCIKIGRQAWWAEAGGAQGRGMNITKGMEGQEPTGHCAYWVPEYNSH